MTQQSRAEQRKQGLEQKRLLLVEGRDDEMVVTQLRALHNLTSTCTPVELEGFANVRTTFANLLKFDDDEKRKERLAVIVDMDETPGSRWASLSSVLRQRGYTVPSGPTPEGVVLQQEGRPTVGIWLMPDNSQLGKLEDFVALLIQPDDVLWPHVLSSLDALPKRLFREQDTIKARIHTWLAWQKEPGIQMSQALKKRIFMHDSETRRKFLAWLTAIFEN